MRPTALALLGVLALGGAVAGCGSDDEVKPAPATPSATAAVPHEHSSVIEFRDVMIASDAVAGCGSGAPADWCAKDGYTPALAAAYKALTCPAAPAAASADEPALACNGTKRYLLGPSRLSPDQILAVATIPPNGTQPVVDITLAGADVRTFADITRGLSGTQRLFAILVDGRVVTAAAVEGAIEDGQVQVAGGFTVAEAREMAAAINR